MAPWLGSPIPYVKRRGAKFLPGGVQRSEQWVLLSMLSSTQKSQRPARGASVYAVPDWGIGATNVRWPALIPIERASASFIAALRPAPAPS
jgi:hypothetical protein